MVCVTCVCVYSCYTVEPDSVEHDGIAKLLTNIKHSWCYDFVKCCALPYGLPLRSGKNMKNE